MFDKSIPGVANAEAVEKTKRWAEDCREASCCATHCNHNLKSIVLKLAVMVSGSVLAADFACVVPADADKKGTLDKVEEVFVTTEEATTGTNGLQSWDVRIDERRVLHRTFLLYHESDLRSAKSSSGSLP